MRSASTTIHRLAYDIAPDTRSWLSAIGEAMLGFSAHEHGVVSMVSDVESGHVAACELVQAAAFNRTMAYAFEGSAAVRALLERSGVHRASDHIASDWVSRALAACTPDFLPTDTLNMVGRDEAGAAVVLAFPSTRRAILSDRAQKLAGAVIPHLGAGLRLRRAVDGLPDDSGAIEARFRTDGHCLDASGAARSRERRQRLREAVLASEKGRAEGPLRGSEERPTIDAIIDGRWSLVERFENDGRRYIVAYRNPPGVGDMRRLTRAERDTVRLVASGMTNKEAGYALGVGESTASTALATALPKLGLRTALELPMFWRHQGGRAVAFGREEDFAYYSAAIADLPASVSLTGSEDAVLAALLSGSSNDDIAGMRGTSPRTVANQVASIFRKFNVYSRRELAAKLEGIEALD